MVQFAVEDFQDTSKGALIGALLKSKAQEFIVTVENEMNRGKAPAAIDLVGWAWLVGGVDLCFFPGAPQQQFVNGECAMMALCGDIPHTPPFLYVYLTLLPFSSTS